MTKSNMIPSKFNLLDALSRLFRHSEGVNVLQSSPGPLGGGSVLMQVIETGSPPLIPNSMTSQDASRHGSFIEADYYRDGCG
jgi:hypothetical protein